MRKSYFGDTIIDSIDDDLGLALLETENEVFADIFESEEAGDEGYWFEVRTHPDGDEVAHSETLFKTAAEAKKYLRSWIDPSEINVLS